MEKLVVEFVVTWVVMMITTGVGVYIMSK